MNKSYVEEYMYFLCDRFFLIYNRLHKFVQEYITSMHIFVKYNPHCTNPIFASLVAQEEALVEK